MNDQTPPAPSLVALHSLSNENRENRNIAMETALPTDDFTRMVRAFYDSLGYRTQLDYSNFILTITQWLTPVSVQTGSDRVFRVALPHASQHDEDVDMFLVDDSPAGSAQKETQDGVCFGRELLFPDWEKFIEREQRELDIIKTDIDLPKVEFDSGDELDRLLLCGDSDEEVVAALRQKRRQILNSANGQEFTLPLALDPVIVREQGLLTSIRDRLMIATRIPFKDEVYLGALRRGYIHIFVDWIGDWNLNGNLDPNHGTIAELLYSAGPSGHFTLGCDKVFVFHYVPTEITHDESSDFRRSMKYRTLGQRFSQDPKLSLGIITRKHDETYGSETEFSAGTDDRFLAYRRTRGLLGPDDWLGLLRDLAIQAYQMEQPGYLKDSIVYEAILSRLHPDRRLGAYVFHVMSTVHGSGYFNVDAKRGLRFSRRSEAEEFFVRRLHRAFEDLREYGIDGERGGTLMRISTLLSVPQLNERIIHKALQRYARQRDGRPESCKELVLDYLGIILHKGATKGLTDLQLRKFRCGVFRVIIVLNAWLRLHGDGLDSLKGVRVDLSGIDTQQLYICHLDLSEADLSNITLPFAVFDECTLRRTLFSTSYLPSARFVGGKQESATFDRADLTTAIIKEGDYTGASFQGASLWAAELNESNNLETKGSEDNLAARPGQEALAERFDLRVLEACLYTLHQQSIGADGIETFARYHCWRPDISLAYSPEKGGRLSMLSGDQEYATLSPVWCYHCRQRERSSLKDPLSIILATLDRSGLLRVYRIDEDGGVQKIGKVTIPDLSSREPFRPKLRILGDLQSLAVTEAQAKVRILSFERSLLDRGAKNVIREPDLVLDLPGDMATNQGRCLLDVIEEHVSFLLVGQNDGQIAVFRIDLAKGRLVSDLPGASPPVEMAFVATHRQVIVAREDNSVDVLYLDSTGSLQRLTTFQLAHERIHSILTYPDQPRYLVAGSSPQSDSSIAPSTLFAMCNANLQVLAVWENRHKQKELEEILFSGSIRAGSMESQFGRGLAEIDPGNLGSLIASLQHEGSLEVVQTEAAFGEIPEQQSFDGAQETRGYLKLRLSLGKPFIDSISGDVIPFSKLLSVRSGGGVYHLRFSLKLFRYSPKGHATFDRQARSEDGKELERSVRQDAIEMAPEIDPSTLLLSFQHPILDKASTLMFPHAVELRVSYEIELRDGQTSSQQSNDFNKLHLEPAKSGEARLFCPFSPKRPNPFRKYFLPVSGSDFFARRTEVNEKAQHLLIGNALVVSGARRSGKSSVLRELSLALRQHENVVVVNFDLETKDIDLARLTYRIIREVPAALRRQKQKTGFDADAVIASCDDPESPMDLLRATAEALRSLGISNPIIVVMLDEWGHLLGASEGFSIEKEIETNLFEFQNQLRAVIGELQDYRFVFSGLPWHFERLAAAKSSVLISYAAKYSLKPAGDEIVEEMVLEKLRREDLTINKWALREVVKLASGSLHDANLIMYEAVNTMFAEERGGSEIRIEYLSGVAAKLVEHYKGYWDAICKGLDEAARIWIEEKVRDDAPIWEKEPLTRIGAPIGVDPFFDMGYYRYCGDLEEDVLSLPEGLKMCIQKHSHSGSD